MPRYFFNVHGQTAAAPDLIGRSLADDEAAKAEAKELGKEFATDAVLIAGLANDGWIEVTDENQRQIALLPLADEAADPHRIE